PFRREECLERILAPEVGELEKVRALVQEDLADRERGTTGPVVRRGAGKEEAQEVCTDTGDAEGRIDPALVEHVGRDGERRGLEVAAIGPDGERRELVLGVQALAAVGARVRIDKRLEEDGLIVQEDRTARQEAPRRGVPKVWCQTRWKPRQRPPLVRR